MYFFFSCNFDYFFGKYLPLQGAELALGTVLFIFSYSAALLYEHATKGIANEFFINVGSIGSYDLEFGWVVDGLSIMMYFVVGTVSSLVFIYATNYMQGEIRYTFFLHHSHYLLGVCYFSLFSNTFAIVDWLGISWSLFLSTNWSLLGKKENSSAAMKAFITNKIADVGLMIGIIVLALSTKTLRISEILYQSTHDYADIKTVAYLVEYFFIGAMGKSAQFPLHVWLPDAMAGPTPVSALMHAATMVPRVSIFLAACFLSTKEWLHKP